MAAARLFARRKSDDKNPITAAEADLAFRVAERRRIDDQLADARARLDAAVTAHEAALLAGADKAGVLASERTDAQTSCSGLQGLRMRIDAEIAEAEVELAAIRETTQRNAEADRLDAALIEQASAAAKFEPAAAKLVVALEAMGASDTAQTFKVLLEQARRQFEADRAAIQMRASNLRKPAPISVPQPIVTPPAPHGQVAHGSFGRGPNARAI
jgi:hypothetical protein